MKRAKDFGNKDRGLSDITQGKTANERARHYTRERKVIVLSDQTCYSPEMTMRGDRTFGRAEGEGP